MSIILFYYNWSIRRYKIYTWFFIFFNCKVNPTRYSPHTETVIGLGQFSDHFVNNTISDKSFQRVNNLQVE